MNRLSTPVMVAISAIVIAAVGVAFWLTHSSAPTPPNKKQNQEQTENHGAFAAPPGATEQPLGEVGPSACWPEKSFATKQGASLASKWYKTSGPADDPDKIARLADRDVTYLEIHADYYLPREVQEAIPNWPLLNNQDRMAAYTAALSVQQLKSPMRVQNTYCDKVTGQVTNWDTQVFPVGEWIGFIPGHEPGTADPRPARKMVCGNWLGRPPVLKPETTSPPTNGTTSPPTGGTTPPPPTTTTGNSPKVPGEAPNGGTGTDRQTAGPVATPQVPKPTQTGPAPAPPPPPPNPVPGGTPVSTTNAPLPVEPGGGGSGCTPSPTDPCP